MRICSIPKSSSLWLSIILCFGVVTANASQTISDYNEEITKSALLQHLRSTDYFLYEQTRLEWAGADFVHSERLCQLKYISELFKFDPSLNPEKPLIQQTIDQIYHNIVGQNLIENLEKHLSTYNTTLVNELLKKKKIDATDSDKTLETLINYNNLKLRKADKTLFTCAKPIKNDTDYWAVNLDKYENYFQLIIDIRDCKDVDISVLHYGLCETEINYPTPFKKILFHELVHVLDFLEDKTTYRLNNMQFQWNPTLNTWWSTLSDKYDGLKLSESWDYRITELQAVIGREYKAIHDSQPISNFSELSFSVADLEKCIRLPYKMCELCVHKSTARFLFKSSVDIVTRFLKQMKRDKEILIIRSSYSKEYL